MYYPSQPKWIKPAQFQVNPEATENFIRNIAALQDPKGTLERMQVDQVIKSMANLKTDELSGLYKKYALDAINKYSEASLKL
jgi:hypothetical protein